MSGYNPNIDPVRPDEPVSAGVSGRATTQLLRNVTYLRNLVNSMRAGRACYLLDVPIDPALEEGYAVYFNETTERYEAAQVGLETQEDSAFVVLSASSYVWGLLKTIHVGGERGDLLVLGVDELNFPRQAGDGDLSAGLYYLSATSPGRLTRLKPAIAVPVLHSDGRGLVKVNPSLLDPLSDHEHISIELVCRPAGDHSPPSIGNPHSITSPDADLPGWLPANHASFEGKAPSGARFGYNFATHDDLASKWPPYPLTSCELVWDRGEDTQDGGKAVPPPLYVVNAHGLWWMSNCYGDVPWPTDYDSESTENEEVPVPPLSCPRPTYMRMAIHLTRLRLATGDAIVKTLRAKDKSGVAVYCQGNPLDIRSTGDLEVALNCFGSTLNNTTAYAYKSFNPLTGELERGPVVGGIKAGASNLLITGGSTDADGYKHGRLTINFDASGSLKLLETQIIKLEGATLEYPGDLPAIGLLTGKASNAHYKMKMPIDNMPEDSELILRLWIGGSVTGTIPGLRLFYRRYPRPATNLTESLAVSETEVTTGWSTIKAITADHYFEVDSPAIPVDPGDTVIVRLSRDIDAYSGSVYLLEFTGRIEAAS